MIEKSIEKFIESGGVITLCKSFEAKIRRYKKTRSCSMTLAPPTPVFIIRKCAFAKSIENKEFIQAKMSKNDIS